MGDCKVLYDSSQKAKLAGRIKTYIKSKNFSQFKDGLLKGSIPKETKFTLQITDDATELHKSIIALYNDIFTITQGLKQLSPKSVTMLDEFISLIKYEFQIDADETQSASTEEDSESKTQEEIYDKNRNSLQEHLKEIYGTELYDVIMTLGQEFYDDIIGAAYYDVMTGEAVDMDNSVLNVNIKNLKSKYLTQIKSYLDEQGIKYTDSFYGVQQAFFAHLKGIQDIKSTFNKLQSDKIKEKHKQDKIEKFSQLVEKLKEDPQFIKKVYEKLNQYQKHLLTKSLYVGDCYSHHYIAVKKYILENRPDLQEVITEIEKVETNLLEAANAYSKLSHFDEMLVDRLGKQISIQDGTKNLEIDDKYSYHQDTAHETKSWQTSEDIGSEKHTSNFTKGVFSVIRIFDHNTNEFKNKRLNSTSYIVAIRHLIDDIIYGNIYIEAKPALQKLINDLVVTYHYSPSTNLQKLLELLFDTTPGVNTTALKDSLSDKRLLTDTDLDILYSIYLRVFNKKDPTSFISQEIQGQYKNRLGASLIQEIAAYADSNVIMDYMETKIDWETGNSIIKVKKKYFNNAALYRMRKSINSGVNSKSMQARTKLQEQYELTVTPNLQESYTSYSITLDKDRGVKISLKVPNMLKAKILTSSDKKTHVSFEDTKFFQKLDEIDLIEFRQYMEGSYSPAEGQKENFETLKKLLTFIDSYLGLNLTTNIGLHTLQVYKAIYSEVNGMRNFLMPLTQLAIRAAYVNNQYIQAGDIKMSEFLKDDPLYQFFKTYPTSKIFSETFGNVKYTVASFADEALNQWADAFSMLTGEASKATTKDGQGNSIPNNSVSKMGGILHYYTHKQRDTNCQSLMFVDNPRAIRATYHDLEASNIHGDTKSIKQFSCGELFFHSIFNKFWGNYNSNNRVIIQPTVYSDKTTFLNWEIETDLLQNSDNEEEFVSKIVQKYRDSLGSFYEAVYEYTQNKLGKLQQFYNSKYGTAYTLNEFLKAVDQEQLLVIRDEYNEKNPNDIIDLEKDKDYRQHTKIVTNADGTTSKIKYCTTNEILEYNYRVYNDESLLRQALENEKYVFLQNLIDYNTSFQVLNFTDDISYYTSTQINEKATSKNPIINTILQQYTKSDMRKEYFENWVDAKTGKLILAKQNGKNILGIAGDFDKNAPGMVLNPLLNKFFYVEGLLSNNLRMSLTGSEINHPDKAFDTLFSAAKKMDFGDFSNSIKTTVSFEQFRQIQDILKKCDNVSELYEQATLATDEGIKQALMDVYDKTILKIINTAQGTQFKRNVIIPATLQYCQQGTKNGISRKIKCAVIEDEQAAVNNYRGETKEVDSADGSAQINPFQSILENLSLGSQAVGFIKKPIWHSYDSNSGTAFLAKFATDTITNEVMRSSTHSKTNLFKVFKKMTNLPWKEPIDLTKPIHKDTSYLEEGTDPAAITDKINHENWFTKVILENQKLFYQNQFGERMQILILKKTTTNTGEVLYYTEEQNQYGEKFTVYHMFDKYSNHITFDSYQKALAFKQQNPQDNHTIKSLFELHQALGGIECVDSEGKGSEFNNKVVVNFMNNIGYKKEGTTKKDVVNQDTYVQPLKDYHIGYALNSTAVKNGAKNINKANAWEGDTDLRYFEVDSDGLGMQMNADHDVVNSELTEFSQVIAATAAYGYTYDNCNEIFIGLARTAVEASKQVLDAVDSFLKETGTQAQSDLYDAIGRIVMMERSIKDKESLEGIIWEAVQKVFNKHKDHTEDSVKIPFSDSNIYSDFVATLGSAITKASIKRKHPGSGCVMAPGYNVITYFEVGDKKYSQRDMLNQARQDLKNDLLNIIRTTPYSGEDPLKNPYQKTTSGFETYNGKPLTRYNLRELIQIVTSLNILTDEDTLLFNTSDITNFNKGVVDRYLTKLQEKAPTFLDKSYFQPEDVVRIIQPKVDLVTGQPLLDDAGQVITNETTLPLDSMQSYYAFKDHDYPEGTIFQIDVRTPRNLKPSLIRWRYTPAVDLVELGITKSEVYDKPWKSDPTKTNQAFTLSLNEDPLRKFEIVKDYEDGYWSIHFKTIGEAETFETAPKLTSEQKQRLFKAAASKIPVGDKLSTWGEITKGGISGLNRFKHLGFNQVESRTISDKEGNEVVIPVYERVGTYMNIFDLPVIKEAFNKGGKLDANYRKQVQGVLNDLHKGVFTMNGITYQVIPGSLENTEAELVMSNLYKEVFGIEQESLQEILDQGEQYFVDQIENNIHAPQNSIYDLAFLKDNGRHVLIKFGEVKLNEYCQEDNFTNTSVEEKMHQASGRVRYNIYAMKGSKPLFKIGEYVNVEGDESSDLYVDGESIKSHSGKEIDQSQYRIHGNIIQKRIDFVKRYKLTTKKVHKKTGKVYYTTNTMYKIINQKDLEKHFGNETDAFKQIGSLITNLYLQDNYKFVELNSLKEKQHLNQFATINSYMTWFLNNNYVSEDQKEFVRAQLDHIHSGSSIKNFTNLMNLKREFYRKEAHKKWVSFQDSLKFISSRIPAQTLQSFMAMKCVGWTENTKNMAYVSHFQIYLQGSDYDIDKAYIMGQSYDGNGQYIQWSPLFDFTDLTTLALSKQLPTPRKMELIKTEDGVDVTAELTSLLNNTDDKLKPLSYNKRIENLKTIIKLLQKINQNNGQIQYRTPESDKLKALFNLINSHIYYNIPENVAESAYKNVASSNIYAVSHDIRNRDQCYTAITMKTFQKSAEKSPKGEQAATLNMLNPLTKYIMQYQNLVGKNVISIAANGEKVWFNAYYYWTKMLKEGRPHYLQFQTTLKRINGRSKMKINNLKDLPKKALTKTILPDLNPYDEELKAVLLANFGVDLESEEYAYVDQLISQLLSAATDNAKELILDKINSSNNFARMYIYLIMTGYNLDDIVSFMISPASSFIDSMANSNMFSDFDLNNSPSKAINLGLGMVKSYSFLRGTIKIWDIDEEFGDTVSRNQKKTTYVFERLSRSEFAEEASRVLKLSEDETFDNLDHLMQGLILAGINNPKIDLTTLLDTNDTEINTYLQYCQNLIYKLREVASKYENLYEMQEDVNEFKKIYQLSSEISSIASAWLGLNQGLPTDELSLLKRFSSMRKVITDRENALGLYDSKMFTDSKDPKVLEKTQKYFDKVVEKILDNNSQLDRDQVVEALKQAHEKDLIGTFDIYRYLTDVQYRQDMIDYNHIIKGTLNVLHMMEEIPHYKETIECLKALAVSKHALSSKSRLITKLLQESNQDYLNDQQLRGIIRYVDRLNAMNFAKSLKQPFTFQNTIEGFDTYFNKIKTDRIDLTTLEGMATFKHWVEHEFLEDLRANHTSNPLIPHLTMVSENQRDILATDIDLLNPNTTSITRQSYNDILQGMARFETEYYQDTEYTIADILQLYNILVNSNQYGAERLTTTFKACSKTDSILNKYFTFVADQDFDSSVLQDYEMVDYYINAAPIVSTGAERFRTEKFIKVNDPVEGYILKRYNQDTNSYEPYNLIPAKDGVEPSEHRLQRLQNFVEYCPFEMPTMAKVAALFSALEFEGEVTPEILSKIQNILLDFSSVGKLIVFKQC